MGHERQVGPSKDSHISPNRKGLLFSSNPPRFDPRRENPSDKDEHDSNNGIPSTETRIAGFLNRQSGKILPFLMVGLGGGAAGTGLGVFLGTEIIASEEKAPETRSTDSVSGGTSFSNDGPQIVSSEQVGKPKGGVFDNEAKRIVENSNPNAIKAKKFEIPPPNRMPSEDMSSQYIPIDQLSTIKEYTAEYSRDGTYDNFQPGIGFMLEGRPPASYTARRVTPKGIELVETGLPYNATIGISGYIIGKEIHDGNVFLAVYAPGKNGLPNQDNIENSLLSVENISDDGNEGKIYNTIVWLEVQNFQGYMPPFAFSSAWHENTTLRSDHEKVTNIPQELFRYIKIGDPVRAGALPQIPHWAPELLDNNYKEQKNHLTYGEAQAKYLSIVNKNAEAIQRMLDDAKTEGVTLKEQFETKRYVLQVSNIRFVPRD